jgi:hypothetical protein
MEDVKVKGKVVAVGELYQKGEFKKRDLIVKTDGDYPQVFALEFVKDKEELLDIISVGQTVNVSVNLRGREWINPQGVAKYFSSLSAWKIDVL